MKEDEAQSLHMKELFSCFRLVSVITVNAVQAVRSGVNKENVEMHYTL